MRTHFKTLGLEPTATLSEIKAAHRSLIRQWHPDRFPLNDPRHFEAQETAKKINEAYQSIVKEREDSGTRPRVRPAVRPVRKVRTVQRSLRKRKKKKEPAIKIVVARAQSGSLAVTAGVKKVHSKGGELAKGVIRNSAQFSQSFYRSVSEKIADKVIEKYYQPDPVVHIVEGQRRVEDRALKDSERHRLLKGTDRWGRSFTCV